MRVLLTVLVTVGLSLLVGVAIVNPLSDTTPARRTDARGGMVAEFNRITYTNETSVGDARRYQVVVLQYSQGVSRLIDSIHAADPGVKLLIYQAPDEAKPRDASGATVCNDWNPSDPSGNGGLPAPWFLHDRSGQRIYTTAYAGSYRMNVGSPAYQRSCLAHILSRAQAARADGVFFDGLGASLAFQKVDQCPGSLGSAACASDAAWRGALTSLLTTLVAGLHAHHLIAIGNIGGGAAWPGAWRQYNAHLDGAMEESWAIGQDRHPVPVSQWRAQLENVRWSEANHKLAVLHSYALDEPGNAYGLASMLLIAQGGSSYSTSNLDYGSSELFYPEYAAAQALGLPLGPATQLGSGVYERAFVHGSVLVNPSRESVTVGPTTLAPMSAKIRLS